MPSHKPKANHAKLDDNVQFKTKYDIQVVFETGDQTQCSTPLKKLPSVPVMPFAKLYTEQKTSHFHQIKWLNFSTHSNNSQDQTSISPPSSSKSPTCSLTTTVRSTGRSHE
jgi:hypothetical protein